MKTTKRIFACLLIVVMLASMLCVGASAATITVTNASVGTHTAYRMFSLVDGKAVVTTSDDWYDFVATGGDGESYVTLVAHPTIADTFYVYWNGGDEAAFAIAAKDFDKTGFDKVEATVAAGANNTTLTVADNGYYLVLSPAAGAAPALLKVTDTGTVNEKITTVPNISKVADKVTADIGEDIIYTIEVGVEADAKGDYVITDDFAGGKLDITAITVAPPTGTWNAGTDYIIDLANAKVTIDETAIDSLATNDKITITYTAKLKANATINGSNINTATLTYTDGSNTLTQTASDDVWTGMFTFNKYDETSAHLSGAGFKVKNNATSKYATFTQSDNVYTFNGWVATENAGYEIKTAGKTITVQGLDEGTYTLIETTVPAGYLELTTDPTVSITATTDGATGNVTSMSTNHADVTNVKGSALPNTGGIGTTVFYAVGGCLVLGALVILLMKKRTVA